MAAQVLRFAYQAQTRLGQPVEGTLEAASAEEAQATLTLLQVRILDLRPAEGSPKPSRRMLKGDDFLAFNQQLAYLASAGLPLEQGLRLIAEDVRSGRLATVAREVAADLERGLPLRDAFERHRSRFPDMYAQLIEAGARTGNLPGMLFNLGKHLEMISRLRGALWRIAAYPLAIFAGLIAVLVFLSFYVLPQFREIFMDFRTNLPALTEWLLLLGEYMPAILIAVAIFTVVSVLGWESLRLVGLRPAIRDALLLPLPVIGPVLRKNLLARWCGVAQLAVDAGLPLPDALNLAGQTVGSPAMLRETQVLSDLAAAGRSLREYSGGFVLPASVAAAIALTPRGDALASTLATLSDLYAKQAEQRLRTLPTILSPIVVIFVAMVLGLVIMGLFLPLIKLVQSVS